MMISRLILLTLLNTTSRVLDKLLKIKDIYFFNKVRQIYPSKLQLIKANTFDTEVALFNLHLSISNVIVSTKMYHKRADFDFETVNFQF